MPVDPARMRHIVDFNEKVTENIRQTSKRIENLDPRNVMATARETKVWAQNTLDLKKSLDEQKGLIAEMQESARMQDEQQSDSFHEKYRFLVERLKADIRRLFTSLQDYTDLPQDFARSRTWYHCKYDLEMDLKGISAASGGRDLMSVEPLCKLLNYRDAVTSLTLTSLLFRKAVLDWDLKSERAYADGPMVEMSELAVNIFSKTESLPANFRPPQLPSVLEPGPFTFDKRNPDRTEKNDRGGPADLTALQSRLFAVLRERQSLDQGLRTLAFGEKVQISNKSGNSGRNEAADDLRKEMTKWFDKYSQLDKELNSSKGSRNNAWEAEVESLTNKLAEKDQASRKHVTKIHELEGDVQTLKYELAALQREKNNLADQNQQLAKESLPVIDKIGNLVLKSKEASERLSADSLLLSSTFRRRVEENKRIVKEKDDIEREMHKVTRQLTAEKAKNELKEQELQKKETLYLRTMAARKSIQDSYQEQHDRIKKVQDSMSLREDARQQLLRVVQGRDCEIRQFEEDLRRAKHRIDEVKQQRQRCMEEYKSLTGQNLDLSKFEVVHTLAAPSS
eukprot:TRINITY_DN36674_c1_g1_i1.p1 TRINITY_DN36674_c1_g1~~TRINITY_DN36674_c1_g1_i1.p1  ORF type:complete len:566 (-),score=126.86 TRINITY_DN36674_c1_g1_i1:32-1729(-)